MICSVRDCKRPSRSKKLCSIHYWRKNHWGHTGQAKPLRERHGMYYSPEYRIWSNMITRCTNVKRSDYKNYGGRGIKVCNSWRESFEAFYRDIGKRPSKMHSIDRIDVDGNYEPGNVRWTLRAAQNQNQRIKKLAGAYKSGNSWTSTICINYKVKYLGSFKTAEAAHAAYLKAKSEYHTT